MGTKFIWAGEAGEGEVKLRLVMIKRSDGRFENSEQEVMVQESPERRVNSK